MELQGTNELTTRKPALVAGISILLMAVIAGVLMGTLFNNLFSLQGGDLWQALKSSEQSFRWGIVSWIAILLCDILAAWGLGVFYTPVNRQLSQLTAWLRLVYAAILATAISFLVLALQMVAGYANPTKELITSLETYLGGFQQVWSFGLIIFGFHLIGLANLVYKHKILHKIFTILLFIAGIGYLITNLGNLLLANYADYKPTLEAIFMLPMILGEVGLAIWLVAKGGKV